MTCSAEEIKSVLEWTAFLLVVVIWNIAAAWLVASGKKGGRHG